MAAFMIAAAHKSSGKTVISTGLSFALSASDYRVQCFKKGPDYIDPMWLSAASGGPCYNLDFNSMGHGELVDLFASRSKGAGVSLVEANKGLYDGVDLAGCDSNAQMAKLLKLPVVLVIDTNGITRGIAPLLLGYQGFDNDINIAGVILNKVGGARHEAKLTAAVKEYTDIEVLGAVHRNRGLDIGERHLGLTTPGESGALQETIERFGEIVGTSVDLQRLKAVAGSHGFPEMPVKTVSPTEPSVRIGVVRDKAFGFYYSDDLEAFGAAGARLIEIDAINDSELPELDGLFIGGGFPEIAAAELAANAGLRAQLKKAIEDGLPTYAECGGLMYLCKSLGFENQTHPMVGVIDAEAVMHKRPQGRGYVSFSENNLHPWGTGQSEANTQTDAHEFHYASLENIAPDTQYVRQISKGHGIDGAQDGIVMHNLVAGFCHLRNSKQNPWVSRFADFVRSKYAS